jgi:integrase/recombinase XerD
MEQACIGAVTARAIASGPIRRQLAGFIAHLRAQGYTVLTLRSKLIFVAQLSRWLQRRGLALSGLDEDRVRDFLRTRRRRYRSAAAASATAFQLLRYSGAACAAQADRSTPPRDKASRTEAAYREYLRRERALANVTIDGYVGLIRPFLMEVQGVPRRAAEVTRFVLRRSRRMSPGRAKLLVTALRSLLRFLHCTGRTATDLVPCVPTVPDWRHTALPKAIRAADVRRVLRACDRRTPRGRRDHALLLLLARLGLRAGEVVRMTLDDIDWDAGELLVRGKGARLDRLPLPPDVGAALVDYLRDERALDGSRRLFLSSRAPRRGFSSSVAVSSIVRRAIERAGLEPPSRGAHLLRHSLATDLLRRGASLAEIGELLRHRSPDTTMIYAKVDLAALRSIARPWPGGVA